MKTSDSLLPWVHVLLTYGMPLQFVPLLTGVVLDASELARRRTAAPSAPVAPVGPWTPCGPCAPCGPPAGPAGPVSPLSPLSPFGPCVPWAPCGPTKALSSAPLSCSAAASASLDRLLAFLDRLLAFLDDFSALLTRATGLGPPNAGIEKASAAMAATISPTINGRRERTACKEGSFSWGFVGPGRP